MTDSLFDPGPRLRTRDEAGKKCEVCVGACWWTYCADCGGKLSTHDFSLAESQVFAKAALARGEHECGVDKRKSTR